MAKQYNPKEVEEKWRKFWEKQKVFKFNSKSKKKVYSIDTPPPTVSGKMHLGHAFSYAQQDFVIRFKRMNGENVFYPFGTDDNGLATIRLIEREKKVKAFDLGREKFIKLVLETLKKELRPAYISDWKKLGISCDWDIFYTTINEHCRRISQRSFLELYKKGREYRKKTPFMWCPECQTSIAQVEMKDQTRKSQFVYIKFDTSLGKGITIATTRPELMPACVAIHVHPDDKRYKEFIGKKAKLPIFDREVQIYANKEVDMEFGTGAVYHCTFGDMDDIEWIEELKIKPIEVMNKDGSFNELAGSYKGMKSEQVRKEIIKDLQQMGRIEKIEPIEHVVNVHERCGTDVEILMTEQWFIKYLDLKKQMLQWGEKLKWYPDYMKVRYDNWVKGLKWDWSISRQRYFGIPIPVWYCRKCKAVIVADEKQLPVDPLKDKPRKKCKCGGNEFEPEKDVLDTWATSSLTPVIAAELMPKALRKKLLPMSLRPQAHDIITFWLFNTVVKSQLHYKKNPFQDVMISGFVLDPEGKKMSKSKGNVVAPQDIVEKYSADALRFWAASSKLGEDLRLKEKELVAGTRFIKKLFNASKFSFLHLKKKPGKTKPEIIDKWLLDKLSNVVAVSSRSFEKYDYSRTKQETENFFWHDFCDNYLEIIKNRVYNNKKGKESAQYVLYQSLLTILKLMAPITPFITEEIYQSFFRKFEKKKSIHLTEWPDLKMRDKEAEKLGELFIDILQKTRKFKADKKVSVKKEVTLYLEKDKIKKLKGMLEDLAAVTNSKIKEGKFKVEF